jgi:hypothetical protein
MDEAERKRRMAKVYEQLRNCAGCAVTISSKDVGPESMNTHNKGTVSFIETPARRLLITCAHVWDAFLERVMHLCPNSPVEPA